MQTDNSISQLILRSQKSDFLAALVAGKRLTNDGKEWLTAALDPFHDYNHQIAGYPDTDVSQTTVSCYQYEYSLTAPPLAGGDTTWNAHVFSLPLASSFQTAGIYNETTDWSKITEPNPASTISLGPLNIHAVSSSSTLGPTIVANADFRHSVLPPVAGFGNDLSTGCSRIIACGFEVHNTTAEIYKQGAVCTYRMPQAGNANQVMFSNFAATSYGTVTGRRYRAPPTTVAQANLLKGTRTWDAKSGVYATVFQATVANPLLQQASEHFLLDPSPAPGPTSVVVGSPLVPGLPLVNPTNYTPTPLQTMPFDTTGALFTGLSTQTTLTIKARFYVERAPTWAEPQLAVLASPSAGYDVTALELYSQVINMLPPAVMVGENAKGDWWRAVVSVLKHVSGPLGLALSPFIPGASLVGAAVGQVSGQVNTKRPISKQSADLAKESRPQARVVKLISQSSKDIKKKKSRLPMRK